MSNVSQILFLGLLAAGLCLLLLFVIGIYVYRDALRRGMNPILWTLAAVLAPAFTGFIIYLLVRSQVPDLVCPACGMPVEETYVVCPGCGTRLKRVCTSCHTPAEEEWIVCPRCAEPLSGESQKITPPVRRKDKGLRRVLLLVFFVPLFLFVLLCILNLSAPPAVRTTSSLTSCTEEDLARYQEIPAVRDWLSAVQEQDPDGVYVLCWQGIEEQEESGALKKTVYLICRPSAGYMKKIDNHYEHGFLNQTKMVVSFEDTHDPAWSHAYFPLTRVTYCGAQYMGLRILIDGQEISYDLETIDTAF